MAAWLKSTSVNNITALALCLLMRMAFLLALYRVQDFVRTSVAATFFSFCPLSACCQRYLCISNASKAILCAIIHKLISPRQGAI